MYSATSSTISLDATTIDHFESIFQIENGSDQQLEILDIFINDDAVASQRASSEFLKNSYKDRWVSIVTYRTDIDLTDEVLLAGLPFIVKSVNVAEKGASIQTTIKGLRYEF